MSTSHSLLYLRRQVPQTIRHGYRTRNIWKRWKTLMLNSFHWWNHYWLLMLGRRSCERSIACWVQQTKHERNWKSFVKVVSTMDSRRASTVAVAKFNLGQLERSIWRIFSIRPSKVSLVTFSSRIVLANERITPWMFIEWRETQCPNRSDSFVNRPHSKWEPRRDPVFAYLLSRSPTIRPIDFGCPTIIAHV